MEDIDDITIAHWRPHFRKEIRPALALKGRIDVSEALLEILMELAPAGLLREALPEFQRAVAIGEAKLLEPELDEDHLRGHQERARELLHELRLASK